MYGMMEEQNSKELHKHCYTLEKAGQLMWGNGFLRVI